MSKYASEAHPIPTFGEFTDANNQRRKISAWKIKGFFVPVLSLFVKNTDFQNAFNCVKCVKNTFVSPFFLLRKERYLIYWNLRLGLH